MSCGWSSREIERSWRLSIACSSAVYYYCKRVKLLCATGPAEILLPREVCEAVVVFSLPRPRDAGALTEGQRLTCCWRCPRVMLLLLRVLQRLSERAVEEARLLGRAEEDTKLASWEHFSLALSLSLILFVVVTISFCIEGSRSIRIQDSVEEGGKNFFFFSVAENKNIIIWLQ
jgi:hypothetical protein